MKLRKIVAGLGVSLVLVTGFSAVQTVVPTGSPVAPVAAQAWSSHDAVIKNTSTKYRLEICKHWTTYPNPRCDYSEGTWYLSPMTNSRRGSDSPHWHDTDAIYVPYNFRVSKPGKNWGPGWHKVSGCGGCYKLYRPYKHKTS